MHTNSPLSDHEKRLHSPVVLELYDGELSCDLDGMEGHELRPVIRRVLDPNLYRGRRPGNVVLCVHEVVTPFIL